MLGLPDHLAPDEVTDFAEGAEALAAELGFVICGGDLSAQPRAVRRRDRDRARADERRAGRPRRRATRRLGRRDRRARRRGRGALLLERKLGGLDAEMGEALIARQLARGLGWRQAGRSPRPAFTR